MWHSKNYNYLIISNVNSSLTLNFEFLQEIIYINVQEYIKLGSTVDRQSHNFQYRQILAIYKVMKIIYINIKIN